MTNSSIIDDNTSECSSTPSISSRKKKGGFQEIEVIELNRNNFKQIWPYLLVCIKSCDFVGIDLELSGLGGKGIRSKNIEERYEAIREAAATRSILSLGIATMKLVNKNDEKKRLRYETQVFNILTLSEKPFTIEPSALKFLADHSFDFNRLIKTGVQFQGNECPLKILFNELLASSASLCLHNGFVDLVFIYQQLYGVDLPPTLEEFCHNLADLFPPDYLPIIDSKYLAEFQTRMPSSYLEYVFRKTQGDNEISRQNGRFHLDIRFADSTKMMQAVREAVERTDCSLPQGFPNHPLPIDLQTHLCKSFSYHGFCNAQKSGTCPKLHDVDYTIDIERIKSHKKNFKRKRRYSNVISETVACENARQESEWISMKFDKKLTVKDVREEIARKTTANGLHRAGVDAFMTVFSVVYQQRIDLINSDIVDKEYVNKLPLTGKDQPLQIRHRNLVGSIVQSDDEAVNAHRIAISDLEKRRESVRNNLRV